MQVGLSDLCCCVEIRVSTHCIHLLSTILQEKIHHDFVILRVNHQFINILNILNNLTYTTTQTTLIPPTQTPQTQKCLPTSCPAPTSDLRQITRIKPCCRPCQSSTHIELHLTKYRRKTMLQTSPIELLTSLVTKVCIFRVFCVLASPIRNFRLL